MPALPPDQPPPPRPAGEAQEQRWQALLEELRTLNARLEYVRLMLKLGVRRL